MKNLFLLAQVTIPNPLAGSGVNSFPTLLTRIIGYVGGLVASLSVIMFIIAGILFLVSAGSQNTLSKAKSALTYAVIGLVIALAAGAIAATISSILGVT